MRKINNFTYKVTLESDNATRRLKTLSIVDNEGNDRSDLIEKRNLQWFIDMHDMEETLNWNLNGDQSKFKFQWWQGDKQTQLGYTYVIR